MCVGAGKDDPPPEAVVLLLLEATSFWEVAPLLMRAQSLGIPSVLEDAWKPGCVWLGMLPGAKSPRHDVTMWWNRVDIVPNVPKCPVPATMLYRYRYQLQYIHAYRYRRYRH